jgi:hypothetical protein
VSRNLCQTNCRYCGGEVALDEAPRGITRKDCGVYIDEYEGMLVANASCEDCKGKYLAWCSTAPKHRGWGDARLNERGFHDLSYRSTFNDEDGPEDWPLYRVRVLRVREPLPVCKKCGHRMFNERDYIGNGKTCEHVAFVDAEGKSCPTNQ